MKVEITENSVKLIAETSFDREALMKLRNKGVDSVRFEDDWDQEGPLILSHGQHPWDSGHPGGR